MFTSAALFSGFNAVSNTVVRTDDIPTMRLRNMMADELYATRKVLIHFNWQIPDTWDFDTYLHAEFRDSTLAGNVDYSSSIVTSVKIKKRYAGDFTWQTIYEKEIHSDNDFNIEFYDYYEPANRDIEYAYVAVVSNADANVVYTVTIHSDFADYFIVEKDESHPLIVNMVNTPTYNRESATIVSPGRKYPYVVNNGIARYYSGTIEVVFIEMDEHCDLDLENGWSYRNRIDQFLANGHPKILKSFEGDMWMVNIVGDLPRTVSDGYQIVTHQIEWVECGDPNLAGDLYDNGFINTDSDRE